MLGFPGLVFITFCLCTIVLTIQRLNVTNSSNYYYWTFFQGNFQNEHRVPNVLESLHEHEYKIVFTNNGEIKEAYCNFKTMGETLGNQNDWCFWKLCQSVCTQNLFCITQPPWLSTNPAEPPTFWPFVTYPTADILHAQGTCNGQRMLRCKLWL